MDKYVISSISCDGYERYANIKSSNGMNLTVHFFEYDEYIDNNKISVKKKKGDSIAGMLSIDMVSISEVCSRPKMFKQDIFNSSHIKAIVEVISIKDPYSIFALTTITNSPILVEFEGKVAYKVHELIYIEGSLEIDIISEE